MRVRETLRDWAATIIAKAEKYMAGDDDNVVESEPEPESTAVLGQDDVRIFVILCMCVCVCMTTWLSLNLRA